jgi:hypothetical protein
MHPRELLTLRQVCSAWHHLTCSDPAWQPRFHSLFSSDGERWCYFSALPIFVPSMAGIFKTDASLQRALVAAEASMFTMADIESGGKESDGSGRSTPAHSSPLAIPRNASPGGRSNNSPSVSPHAHREPSPLSSPSSPSTLVSFPQLSFLKFTTSSQFHKLEHAQMFRLSDPSPPGSPAESRLLMMLHPARVRTPEEDEARAAVERLLATGKSRMGSYMSKYWLMQVYLRNDPDKRNRKMYQPITHTLTDLTSYVLPNADDLPPNMAKRIKDQRGDARPRWRWQDLPPGSAEEPSASRRGRFQSDEPEPADHDRHRFYENGLPVRSTASYFKSTNVRVL